MMSAMLMTVAASKMYVGQDITTAQSLFAVPNSNYVVSLKIKNRTLSLLLLLSVKELTSGGSIARHLHLHFEWCAESQDRQSRGRDLHLYFWTEN